MIRSFDYWLARLAVGQKRWLWRLAKLESGWYANRLKDVRIKRPVFICGLARCGSTMLLELLAKQPGMATHRYRDFPFISVPIWWNHFLDLSARESAPRTRAHGDLIQITPQSPEGMEEILWSDLDCEQEDVALPDEFIEFYLNHVRKVLWLRQGQRYLSKNNYHVNRIPRLLQIFPDAQFVIPMRDKTSQVASLAHQHAHFCKLAASDRRVGFMMAAAAHYEFGPQRKVRGLSSEAQAEIERCWRDGDETGGYAIMWDEVYSKVNKLLADPQCARSLRLVKYEEFCEQPGGQTDLLCEWLGIADKKI